jgi:hypothetical protein
VTQIPNPTRTARALRRLGGVRAGTLLAMVSAIVLLWGLVAVVAVFLVG